MDLNTSQENHSQKNLKNLKNQQNIDKQNAGFWNEMCGTQLAKNLGITDHSQASLKKFDDFYFDFYPYLERYVPFNELKEKNVLEVGLGYGSLSQRLFESGCNYHGLDIAKGPVELVSHRLKLREASGTVEQGSILECPFPDNTFDYVIAIGCYHHTGNLKRALDETYRVLKPNGKAILMVYNAYSYKRWIKDFPSTVKYSLCEVLGTDTLSSARARERVRYDANLSGDAAPETVFSSMRLLRKLTKQYSGFQARRENVGGHRLLRVVSRNQLLTLGRYIGTDIYFSLIK